VRIGILNGTSRSRVGKASSLLSQSTGNPESPINVAINSGQKQHACFRHTSLHPCVARG
jgi:hypothetical protein